jgi:hypothetical protein
MNNLAGGSGSLSGNATELLKITAEREEENLKHTDKKLIDFSQ